MTEIRFDVNDPEARGVFFRRQLCEAVMPLRDDSRPGWGMLTAQQMVEHLVWAFELSTEQAQAECRVPETQRERFKTFLFDNRPTPHEFMNPTLAAGLPPLRYGSLAEAKTALRVEVDRFLRQSGAAPGALHTNPVFGPLGAEEWARAHFKHAYHHLLQFGLIAEAR